MSEQTLMDQAEATIFSLPHPTQIAPHEIISRTLLNKPNTRVVLFGFARGQELTEHTSTSHALVQILSGRCDFSLEGRWHQMKAGDVVYMPPDLKHALKATESFSMLLTLFKPSEGDPVSVTKVGC